MSFLLLFRCFIPFITTFGYNYFHLEVVLSVRIQDVDACLLGVFVSLPLFVQVLFEESMTWVQLQKCLDVLSFNP